MLTVCNPNENKVEQKELQKEKDKAKLGGETSDIAQKTPQKGAPGEFNDAVYYIFMFDLWKLS